MVRGSISAKAFLLAVLALMVAAFCAYAEMYDNVKHPVEVTRAVCSECHEEGKWDDQDHVQNWDLLHKFPAARDSEVCNVCHIEAFCADCHANKEEIKPSDKYKGSPQRSLPHRGDYLTQHMIDGKINPASCFRCHGRQNNEKCRVCHR